MPEVAAPTPPQEKTFEERTASFVIDTSQQQEETQPNADEKQAQGKGAQAAETEGSAQNDTQDSDAGADSGGAEEAVSAADAGATAESNVSPKRKLTAAERHDEIQRKTNDLTRQLRETERQVAEALARLDSTSKGDLTQKAPDTTKAGGDAPPDPNDAEKYPYGSLDEKFIADSIAHGVKSALNAKEAADEKKRQDAAAEKRKQELEQKAEALRQAGAEKYDDFDEKVVEGARNKRYPLTPTLGELILSSPEGADVAYYLASNLKEAVEVSGKSPMEQAAWFGRKAATYSSKDTDAARETRVVKVPKAPPPIQPARGAGSNQGFDPAVGTSADDFEKFKREFGPRRN